MPTSKHFCCGRIQKDYVKTTCGRLAEYEHKGKWYCKIHHPPSKLARSLAPFKKYKES